jgi:TolA-binding protein
MNTEQNNNINLEHIRKIYYWRTAFFGLVILIAGIVIGGASISIYITHRTTRPAGGPEFNSLQVIPPLRRNLNLSQEQSDKIKPIIDGSMKKLQDIRENARTEIESTLQQMNKEISKILNDNQRQRWQRELDRLQRELRPGGQRRDGTGGLRARRGAEAAGRRGRGQREPLRRGLQSRPLTEPNSIPRDVNENEIGIEQSDPNIDR